MTSVEALFCIALVLFSACLSAAEVALFSLSRFQLRSLKENFRPTYRKIKHLLADPGGLLITILVLNEVINISLSTLITGAVLRLHLPIPTFLSNVPTWMLETFLGIGVTAPIILIFCEVTPKSIGARINRVIATLTAGPLTVIYEIFRPLQFILKRGISLLARSRSKEETSLALNGPNISDPETILNEADFLLLLEEGHKEGAIQESELDLIRNVFELDNTQAKDVATPIAQVISLSAQTTIQSALEIMHTQPFSRIPVFGISKKEIVGILYAKDLLRSKLQPSGFNAHISTLMRKPYFVTSNTKLSALFRKFKRQQTHMAILKDPDGEVSGVVTMNDVLDALFEDLFGEEDLFAHEPHLQGREKA